MSKKTNPGDRLEAAIKAVREAEEKNMSATTINRRYRELFAAQDAAKATAGGW